MLKPGDRIDRYTVEDVLGQGGMGQVYRAHDERLDRRVALKVVLAEGDEAPERRDEGRRRLLREARAAAALDHPNAVAIFDVGEIDDTAYIAMELVSGRTLRSAVGSSVPLSDRLRWLADVARALAAAHRKNLVHRDIKPENVMVREDGRVKVLDFGIARRAAAPIDPSAPTADPSLGTLTQAGVQVGTPMYMAPEQIRGDPVDGRVDQFAWGVLAYELLTGRVPWKARDALGLVAAILTQAPDPPRALEPALPSGVESVVLRCLAKAADDRFASMDDVVAALESGAGVPAPTKHEPPATRPAVSDPPVAMNGRLAAPASLATAGLRFSTAEVQEILQRALERQERAGKTYAQSELVEAAREVGIDDASLRDATNELVERGWLERTPAQRERERQKLVRHVASWAVFSVFFFLLDLVGSGGVNWFYYPMLGWGVGVAMHYVRWRFPVALSDKEREKKRRKSDRRRGVEPLREAAVEAGLSALLTATSHRARVAAPSATPRLRVEAEAGSKAPSGATRELDAEAEAAAAAGERRRQRAP